LVLLLCKRVRCKDGTYFLQAKKLKELYPDLPFSGESALCYALEAYNEERELVKRFDPPRKLTLFLKEVYEIHRYEPVLELSEKLVSELGIAANYYLTLAIISVMNRRVLPFEVRFEAEFSDMETRLRESYGPLGTSILKILHLIELGELELARATQYAADGYQRYLRGDYVGALTQLRKAVQILRDDVLPKADRLEGIKNLRKYTKDMTEALDNTLEGLQDLVKVLFRALSIGGPHPGPIPRWLAELAFNIITALIEYLAKTA